MIEIINFKPDREDKNVGLKSDISFTFTKLAPFEPNSEVPLLPNQNKFRQLRDTDVLKIQAGGNIEAILYVDTLATSTTSNLRFLQPIERPGLAITTSDQIKSEVGSVGRVSLIREQVRTSLSNLISIKYKDKTNSFQQIPNLTGLPPININTTDFQIVRAAKGDVLDISDQFRNINAKPTYESNFRFTNFLMASSEAHEIVETIVDEQTIILSKNTQIFVVGQYISLVFSNNFSPTSGGDTSGPTFERDVAVFKVKQIQTTSDNKTQIILEETEKYELLTSVEIQATVLGERVLAIPGIPILANDKSLNASYSLYEYEGLVLGEIPFTNLFIPIGDTQFNKNNFIGNLYIPSVSVIMYENDNEVMLVKEGKSLPGASVEYKLNTKSDNQNQFGNVDVTVKLAAQKQKIPIQGIQRAGTQAITVGTRLVSTPQRLTRLGEGIDAANIPVLGKVAKASGTLPILDASAEAAIATSNYLEEDKFPTEFYFSKQAQIKNTIISLNKYGSIKLQDEVEIVGVIDGIETVIHKAKVVLVLPENQQIVIDKPLPVNIGFSSDQGQQEIINKTKYYINVPQTPLNPSRKYRIVVHATDREDVMYDLNKDNIIDQADQAIVEGRAGLEGLFFPNSADLNVDNKVDQVDIDLIKKKIAELQGVTQ